jgi:hypothetical protein
MKERVLTFLNQKPKNVPANFGFWAPPRLKCVSKDAFYEQVA